MSPIRLEVALHYYYNPTDFRNGDFSAPAVREAIDDFLRWEVLRENESHPIGRESVYVIGERGRAFVEALCAVRLPVKKWVMP
jgi:hypothetical protein